MTLPTLWLVLSVFKLSGPLLRSKSHRLADTQEDDEIEAPTPHMRTTIKGLDLVVEIVEKRESA